MRDIVHLIFSKNDLSKFIHFDQFMITQLKVPRVISSNTVARRIEKVLNIGNQTVGPILSQLAKVINRTPFAGIDFLMNRENFPIIIDVLNKTSSVREIRSNKYNREECLLNVQPNDC